MTTQQHLGRLCFVGKMSDEGSNSIPTQIDTLMLLMKREGIEAIGVSCHSNRFRRLADICWTLLRQRRSIDVQLLQVFSGPGFVVADAASAIGVATRVPVVAKLHGGGLPRFTQRFPNWTNRVFRRAAVIVAPSPYLAREMTRQGLDVEVIPNCIDVSSLPYLRRSRLRPRVLWMRAFHEIYDPMTAVHAFSMLRTKRPDATMTMAGPDRGLRNATETLVRELGLIDAVSFRGTLDEQAKRAAAVEHDLYLHSNRIDNMPVSVLEMGAMGLPIVATRAGGIPDLLSDQENALLVEPGDAESMASSMLQLFGDPLLTTRLSSGGRALAESFSWENVSPMWMELLSRVRKHR